MKHFTSKITFIFLAILILITSLTFIQCKEKTSSSSSSMSAVDFVKGKNIKVPLIAWGADIITIFANGSSHKAIKGSLCNKAGLNLELFREDDFNKQVNMFIQGKIPFLRGTMGMINQASEKLHANPKTRPILIYQHSWSAGGDALVAKKGIRTIKDLKGKTVAIQNYGPHVDYFLKLIKDAGLSPKDVRIVWTKDLVGAKGDTPMAKLYQGNIDAAFVIIPDALALTSNGTVGSGAEDSVKGARIILSTKTANRIISDVYAVRSDYFNKNKKEIKKFVQALFAAEEAVRDLFKSKTGDAYSNLLKASGKLLLNDPNANKDVEGLYADAEHSGFNGNVQFFNNMRYPRNFQNLTREIQSSLIKLGTIQSRSTLISANWDYNSFKKDLRYATRTSVSKFNPQTTQVIAEKYSKGKKGTLFSFEIFFQPNQRVFSASAYKKQFDKVIDFASTYGGALITVEGHSDPMNYLRKKKSGSTDIYLKKIKQAAKNLSLGRASSVKDAVISFAAGKGITLDKNQINVIGHGISSPKFGIPKNKNQWRQNMRVQFKVIQIEVEEKAFKPL